MYPVYGFLKTGNKKGLNLNDMKEQILIVEDDADINNLLAKILRTEHFEPIQAFSGTEAKLLFTQNTPDLILLDLMLPGLSGCLLYTSPSPRDTR